MTTQPPSPEQPKSSHTPGSGQQQPASPKATSGTPTPKPAQPSTAADVGRMIKTGLYMVVAALTTVFVLANAQTVEVDFLFATVEVPLFIALIVALVLGALLALGANGVHRRRKAKLAKARS